MKVSVVIAAYNAEKTLRQCLEACLRQTMPAHEIIVVDDGSTDGTRALVEAIGAKEGRRQPADPAAQLHYIHQPNAGPAAARNRGAWAATGDIIAFTDSDCIPADDWLEHLVAGFHDETVAGVGGTYAIANPESLLARMIHDEILRRHARMDEDVDFLGSFNVAYRKHIFDAAGGFDETFRDASGEDNDLAYRILASDGRLCFTRAAVVAHYHPARLWPYLRTQYRHGYWRVKLYVKHAGRIGGDRYAGLADFTAPPLALGIAALPLLALLALPFPALAWGLGLLCGEAILVYLALQGWKGVPMARRVGWNALLAFPALLFLRDVARGLGSIHGGWEFVVLRKGSK